MPDMDNRAGIDRTSGTPDTAGGHDPPLAVREAARRAGVNERTVRRAITDGRLRAEQIHGSYHIAPADFTAWMSARRVPAGTPTQTASRRLSGGVDAGIADMVPAALFREERERVESLHQQLRDTSALVGMMQARLEAVEANRDRLLAIPAGTDTQTMPQERDAGTLRGDQSGVASNTLVDRIRRFLGR